MPFFSKKQEISLEDFCRDFYDNSILNQKIGDSDVSTVYPGLIKESLIKADNVFASIDLQNLTNEINILRFELFALAWLYNFGVKSSLVQSIFTMNYLRRKKRDDIFDAMGDYNKAISHSTTVGKKETERGKIELARIYKMRMDSADKAYAWAEKAGYDMKDSQLIGSINGAINRLSSEKAWEERITAYFIILTLCSRLGLGSKADYFIPNVKAQFQLQVMIRGFYDGIEQSWNKIKIIN